MAAQIKEVTWPPLAEHASRSVQACGVRVQPEESTHLPAAQGHFVAAQVDVRVREELRSFPQQAPQRFVGRVPGRVQQALRVGRVAGREQLRVAPPPGCCVTWALERPVSNPLGLTMP